jgi:hypothetical protein
MFWILLGAAMFVLFYCVGYSEKFSDVNPNGCRLPDPRTTGMERSLWGRLQSIPPTNMDKSTQYETMHGLPWCAEPVRGSNESECLRRNPRSVQVPYEMNKI